MLVALLQILITCAILYETVSRLPRTRSRTANGLLRKRTATAASRPRKAQKRLLSLLVIWSLALRAGPLDAALRYLPFYSTLRLGLLITALFPVREQIAERIFRQAGDLLFRPREASLDEIVEILDLITTSIFSALSRAGSAVLKRAPARLRIWEAPADPAEEKASAASDVTEAAPLDSRHDGVTKAHILQQRSQSTPDRRPPALNPNATVLFPGALLMTPYPPSRAVAASGRPSRASSRLSEVYTASPLAAAIDADVNHRSIAVHSEAVGPADTEAVDMNTDRSTIHSEDLSIKEVKEKLGTRTRSPAKPRKIKPTSGLNGTAPGRKMRSSVNAGRASRSPPRRRNLSQPVASRLPRRVVSNGEVAPPESGKPTRRLRDDSEEVDVEVLPAAKKLRLPGRSAATEIG